MRGVTFSNLFTFFLGGGRGMAGGGIDRLLFFLVDDESTYVTTASGFRRNETKKPKTYGTDRR